LTGGATQVVSTVFGPAQKENQHPSRHGHTRCDHVEADKSESDDSEDEPLWPADAVTSPRVVRVTLPTARCSSVALFLMLLLLLRFPFPVPHSPLHWQASAAP